MDYQKHSLNWKTRFNDIYWDAKISEKDRFEALVEMVREERRITARDVLIRTTNFPISGKPTPEQGRLLMDIKGWFSKRCIPEIMEDYQLVDENQEYE